MFDITKKNAKVYKTKFALDSRPFQGLFLKFNIVIFNIVETEFIEFIEFSINVPCSWMTGVLYSLLG